MYSLSTYPFISILLLVVLASWAITDEVAPEPEEMLLGGQLSCVIGDTDYIDQVADTSYAALVLGPQSYLNCIPHADAPSRHRVDAGSEVLVTRQGRADSTRWHHVSLHDDPSVSGWIPSDGLDNNIIRINSQTAFVLKTFVPINEYYPGRAELVSRSTDGEELVSDLPQYHGQGQITLVNGYRLEGVEYMLRYESWGIDDGQYRYYQDLMGYVGGELLPLVYSESTLALGDSVDTEEQIIYLPAHDESYQVVLAPLAQRKALLLGQAAGKEQYPFSADISVPIDQCIITSYTRADHYGKLKRRSTTVYHWNGSDLARMYGDDIDFQGFDRR